MRAVQSLGVKEIWLSSEDTGAYGMVCSKFALQVMACWLFSDCSISIYVANHRSFS